MEKKNLSVSKVISLEEKSLICNQILSSLPNWFGVPEAIADYSEQVKSLPLFSFKSDGKVLGFIAIKRHDAQNAEIIVIGVLSEYHRSGIGKSLFVACEQDCIEQKIQCLTVKTLSDMNPSKSYAKTREFYFAMGFKPQMILTDYWDENNPCLVMIKPIIEDTLNAIQMQEEHISFVYEVKFCDSNKAALHGTNISLEEWELICRKNMTDQDEADFIIRKGIVPVAWLKINGLKSDKVWLSMLVVHEKFQHQGIGSFAVRFAEDYVKANGFNALGIHTNVDNIAAQNCYKKLGYTITEENECTNGDGQKRRGLVFYRDHLDAVRMDIDGVPFYVGEMHDFSFITQIGKVFRVFDAMDSGNICFGVERDGKRYFIKYAGARTMDYNGEITGAVARLKNAVEVYDDLQHPYLINLIEHYPVGNGYVAIFDWVDGEGLRSYWDYVGQAIWKHPQSPNYRFRRLPIAKRIAAVDKIMEFHNHVVKHGYVPVDFYDGSMLYDFETDEFHICDIDFYRKAPVKNDMGKMWGSDRFMSPEEYELGASLDEVTAVYQIGAAAFELLCTANKDTRDIDHSFEMWSTTKSLYDVALKAIAPERIERYQSITELIEAWNAAKMINNIQYRQLETAGIKPDMLKYFNRYKKTQKCWRNQNGSWILVDNRYIENWDENRKKRIVNQEFPGAINSGGGVFGAFDDNKLAGFASFFGDFRGTNKQYLWLDMLHVSYEYRNKGIGRKLLEMAADSAKKLGAKKLYISANSSEESQAFYKAIGCVHAEEIIPDLFEAEPFDVHMEYVLN